MAEKEERILIARSSDYALTDTDKGALFEGKIAPHCANVFTRKEAIERMAKGIHYYEWAHDKHFPKWNELNSDIQNDYKNMAEAALNALLGE